MPSRPPKPFSKPSGKQVALQKNWPSSPRVPQAPAVSPTLPLLALAGGAARLHLPELLALASEPDSVPWQPFRPRVQIHRLYGDGETGPSAALIRFEPGGEVPWHRHLGYEHIFILTGSQRDDTGIAEAGTLLIHAPGSEHRITSETGCIALAIYERPIVFLE